MDTRLRRKLGMDTRIKHLWFSCRNETNIAGIKHENKKTVLSGHSQLWDRADSDTIFLALRKSSPQPEINVHWKT